MVTTLMSSTSNQVEFEQHDPHDQCQRQAHPSAVGCIDSSKCDVPPRELILQAAPSVLLSAAGDVLPQSAPVAVCASPCCRRFCLPLTATAATTSAYHRHHFCRPMSDAAAHSATATVFHHHALPPLLSSTAVCRHLFCLQPPPLLPPLLSANCLLPPLMSPPPFSAAAVSRPVAFCCLDLPVCAR
ncbi:hypothetical protein H257_18571 [Aphanomyces astaci]|uniref:Uncharacterized protein n=1 Tax=Aphanomyces astaci TaxID=112090 RepID=W4FAT4_APHAT|nr:hypothetical protein H257_18571 [Aphanomyces astaci]ETV64552.1 hypothetical protein H257_18571 [Aphanomyces astaci]|eukprot:XP_009845966.1 hypothetical protein H257_18571 [Aphanomyces astaci]